MFEIHAFFALMLGREKEWKSKNWWMAKMLYPLNEESIKYLCLKKSLSQLIYRNFALITNFFGDPQEVPLPKNQILQHFFFDPQNQTKISS